MSLSTLVGNIVDIERPAGSWRDSKGIIHIVVERAMRQNFEPDSEAFTDSWETVCSQMFWTEKCPRTVRKPATCLLCLGEFEC